jgi:hypothetical protein
MVVALCTILSIAPVGLLAQGGSGGGCFDADNHYTKSVLGKVQRTLTDPRLARVREAYQIVAMPADSAVLVTNPGKCNLARVRIDTYRGEGPQQRKLVLVRVGNKYWAEDRALRGGEFTDVYLLDQDLTRVIVRH